MLPQQFRLRRSVDLQRVRHSGRKWSHNLAILLLLENVHDVSRFAFVAGRRVGNAVTRNRSKRLMREIVRRHMAEIETGWDCLLIIRPAMSDVSYGDVETAVMQLFNRANILRPKS